MTSHLFYTTQRLLVSITTRLDTLILIQRFNKEEFYPFQLQSFIQQIITIENQRLQYEKGLFEQLALQLPDLDPFQEQYFGEAVALLIVDILQYYQNRCAIKCLFEPQQQIIDHLKVLAHALSKAILKSNYNQAKMQTNFCISKSKYAYIIKEFNKTITQLVFSKSSFQGDELQENSMNSIYNNIARKTKIIEAECINCTFSKDSVSSQDRNQITLYDIYSRKSLMRDLIERNSMIEATCKDYFQVSSKQLGNQRICQKIENRVFYQCERQQMTRQRSQNLSVQNYDNPKRPNQNLNRNSYNLKLITVGLSRKQRLSESRKEKGGSSCQMRMKKQTSEVLRREENERVQALQELIKVQYLELKREKSYIRVGGSQKYMRPLMTARDLRRSGDSRYYFCKLKEWL